MKWYSLALVVPTLFLLTTCGEKNGQEEAGPERLTESPNSGSESTKAQQETPQLTWDWNNIPYLDETDPESAADDTAEEWFPLFPPFVDPQTELWDARIDQAAPVTEMVALPDLFYSIRPGAVDDQFWLTSSNLTIDDGNTLTVRSKAPGRNAIQSSVVAVYPGDVVMIERRQFAPGTSAPVLLSLVLQAETDNERYPLVTAALASGLPSTRTEDQRWLLIEGSGDEAGSALLAHHFDSWCEERITFDTATGRGMYQIERANGTDQTAIVTTRSFSERVNIAVSMSVETEAESYAYQLGWMSLSVRRGPNAVEHAAPGRAPAQPALAPQETDKNVLLPSMTSRGSEVTVASENLSLIGTPFDREDDQILAWWRVPLANQDRIELSGRVLDDGRSIRVSQLIDKTGKSGAGFVVEVFKNGSIDRLPLTAPVWIILADETRVPVFGTTVVLTREWVNRPTLPNMAPASAHPVFRGMVLAAQFLSDTESYEARPEDIPSGSFDTERIYWNELTPRIAAIAELDIYLPGETSPVPSLVVGPQPDPLDVQAALETCIRSTGGGYETRVEFENIVDRFSRTVLPDADLTTDEGVRHARAYRDAFITTAISILPAVRQNHLAHVAWLRGRLFVYLRKALARELIFRSNGDVALVADDLPVARVPASKTPGIFAGRTDVDSFIRMGAPSSFVRPDDTRVQTFTVDESDGITDL